MWPENIVILASIPMLMQCQLDMVLFDFPYHITVRSNAYIEVKFSLSYSSDVALHENAESDE